MSDCFDRCKCTAENIAASGTGADTGNTGHRCLFKCRIQRIDTVYSPHLRCHRIIQFVDIHSFIADAIFLQTKVAVSFNKSRINFHSSGIYDMGIYRYRKIRTNGYNLIFFNQDIANVRCFMDSIMDASVFYTDHRLLFPFNYSLGNDSRIFI